MLTAIHVLGGMFYAITFVHLSFPMFLSYTNVTYSSATMVYVFIPLYGIQSKLNCEYHM